MPNVGLFCRKLADDLGLEKLPAGAGRPDAPFSIHDGHQFVFRESSWTGVTISRMLSRYGLSYLWLRQAAHRVLTRFLHIYQLQASGMAFDRPERLLEHLGLYNLTRDSMRHEAQVEAREQSLRTRSSVHIKSTLPDKARLQRHS